jgi:hypothetical protein
MALAFAPATVSEKSHEFLDVANGLISLSRMLCRLPDYAAPSESRTHSRAMRRLQPPGCRHYQRLSRKTSKGSGGL